MKTSLITSHHFLGGNTFIIGFFNCNFVGYTIWSFYHPFLPEIISLLFWNPHPIIFKGYQENWSNVLLIMVWIVNYSSLITVIYATYQWHRHVQSGPVWSSQADMRYTVSISASKISCKKANKLQHLQTQKLYILINVKVFWNKVSIVQIIANEYQSL